MTALAYAARFCAVIYCRQCLGITYGTDSFEWYGLQAETTRVIRSQSAVLWRI